MVYARFHINKAVFGILILGLMARIIAGMVLPDQSALLVDSIAYKESANQLLAHWRMDNPFQMPLYPLLVALAGHWQMAADIAVSTATIWLVYQIAQELFNQQQISVVAALATACYPPLIFFSVVGLSETLFIAMLLGAFLFWYRGRFAIASVFAVLAILTRPIFAVAPLLLIYFAIAIHRLSLAKTVRHLAVYVLVCCGLMWPWWMQNYQRYGYFVPLTAGFGYTLYIGNNPLNTSGGGNLGIDYRTEKFDKINNPADRDAAMRKAAISYIEAHPKKFIELAGLKFMRMWRPWPANKGYSSWRDIVIYLIIYIPLYVLSALGLFLKRQHLLRLSPILLFCVGYTMIIMVLEGTIRYRLPLEPFLLIFAAVPVSRLLSGSALFDRVSSGRKDAEGLIGPPTN